MIIICNPVAVMPTLPVACDGSCSCQVTMLAKSDGSFTTTLRCSLKGSPIHFPLLISGDIQVCMSILSFSSRSALDMIHRSLWSLWTVVIWILASYHMASRHHWRYVSIMNQSVLLSSASNSWCKTEMTPSWYIYSCWHHSYLQCINPGPPLPFLFSFWRTAFSSLYRLCCGGVQPSTQWPSEIHLTTLCEWEAWQVRTSYYQA